MFWPNRHRAPFIRLEVSGRIATALHSSDLRFRARKFDRGSDLTRHREQFPRPYSARKTCDPVRTATETMSPWWAARGDAGGGWR